MKRFKIVTSPTVIHGRDLPFNAVYGTVTCHFEDHSEKHVVYKNGSIGKVPVTYKRDMPVTYYIQVHTPRFKGTHVFYELWVWFPSLHKWENTKVYHPEFEPIYEIVYDTINKHGLKMKPCTEHVKGEATPGAPHEKRAQEEYNYKTRIMARVLGGIHDESCINNDTNVTPRSFVHPTGFAEKSHYVNNRAYTSNTVSERKAINRNIVIKVAKG